MSEGEYLSIDDRIRLLGAVAAADALRDRGKRQHVLSELRRELAPEFNLGAPGAPDGPKLLFW